MKRLILALAVALSAFGAMAQDKADNDLDPGKDPSWNKSGFFFNANAGVSSRQYYGQGFGLAFGVGYRWYFGGGFSWEVARVNYAISTTRARESSSFQFTTGLRFDTPRLKFLGYRPIYISESVGYNLYTHNSHNNGVTNEGVLGVKITPNLSLGLFYMTNPGEPDQIVSLPWGGRATIDASWGIFGVKVDVLLK